MARQPSGSQAERIQDISPVLRECTFFLVEPAFREKVIWMAENGRRMITMGESVAEPGKATGVELAVEAVGAFGPMIWK